MLTCTIRLVAGGLAEVLSETSRRMTVGMPCLCHMLVVVNEIVVTRVSRVVVREAVIVLLVCVSCVSYPCADVIINCYTSSLITSHRTLIKADYYNEKRIH